jgi:hypothetical protein
MSVLVLRSSVVAEVGGGDEVPSFAETPFAGFWKTISNNVPDDIDPDPGNTSGYAGTIGFDGMTDAWGGGWILPDLGTFGTYGVGPNGGHSDYFGNPVIAFDLETGLWRLERAPYASPSWPDADGWWPDESPGASHTYQQIMGIPEENAIFVASRQTLDSPSQQIVAPAIFHFATGEWSKMATYGGSGNPTMSEGCGAYDSQRNIIWLRGGDTSAAFASFDYNDGATGSWTQHGDQSSESWTMMCRDPVLDILIMIRVANFDALYGIDCNSPNTLRTQLTESGRPSIDPRVGIVYSPRRAAFIIWSDGENVYELKKGAGDWDDATWTYTLLTDGANSVAPAANSTGVLSKLQHIAYGTREFLITCQQTGGATYAFEIP